MRLPRGRLTPVLIAAVVAALAAALLHASHGGDVELRYPAALPGNATVVHVFTGERARGMVSGLHWSPGKVNASIKKAAVVMYSDGTILWLAYTGGDACNLTQRMAEKIKENEQRLPYTAPMPHVYRGVTLYFTVDKRTGGLHVFWCTRDGIVAWAQLGASAAKSRQAFLDVLDTLITQVGINQ